jgi:hypothetical protein
MLIKSSLFQWLLLNPESIGMTTPCLELAARVWLRKVIARVWLRKVASSQRWHPNVILEDEVQSIRADKQNQTWKPIDYCVNLGLFDDPNNPKKWACQISYPRRILRTQLEEDHSLIKSFLSELVPKPVLNGKLLDLWRWPFPMCLVALELSPDSAYMILMASPSSHDGNDQPRCETGS